jgi:hypothetical protein
MRGSGYFAYLDSNPESNLAGTPLAPDGDGVGRPHITQVLCPLSRAHAEVISGDLGQRVPARHACIGPLCAKWHYVEPGSEKWRHVGLCGL